MRRLLLAAAAALLCSTISAQSQAQVQRQAPATAVVAEPMVRRASSSDVQFRRRSPQDRAASVRRIFAAQGQRTPRVPVLNFTSAQLSDSFALTPRTPYIADQGSLSAFHAGFVDTWTSPSGLFYFVGGDSANTHLYIRHLDTRRLLVECTVSGHAGPFDALLYSYGGQSIWSDTSTPYGGVISYLTPPISEYALPDLFVRLRPVDQSSSWSLVGCEVTRVSQ
jgi:hypothetical protein